MNFVSQCHCIAGYVLFFYLLLAALQIAGQLIATYRSTYKLLTYSKSMSGMLICPAVYQLKNVHFI